MSDRRGGLILVFYPVEILPMKSMKTLFTHLSGLELINDNFDSWAESGTLEYSGATVLAGFAEAELLYRLKYTAVFSWEAWGGDAYQLFGAVVVWLRARDYDFDELGWPEFDVEILDDSLADVELRLRFEDAAWLMDGVVVTEEPGTAVVEAISVCGGG